MGDEKLLHIYLGDHLAGAVAGIELAQRSLSNNRGTPLGNFLANLVVELGADKTDLEQAMDRVAAPKPRWKQSAAWAVEKIGRLKLNGRIIGYSDLSRLLELEGLAVGVEGKKMLWRSLQLLQASDDRLSHIDFDRLIGRAEDQQKRLEEHRTAAAMKALQG